MTNEEKLQRLREQLDGVIETATSLARAAYTAAGKSPEMVEVLVADRRAQTEAQCAEAMHQARLALYGPASNANH